MEEGPKYTGRRLDVSLTGGLIPWDGNQPALLNVPGSTHNYMPIFTTQEKLEQLMTRAQTPYDSIKQIQDGREFLTSIPGEIHIMVDPYYTPEGKVRWAEIFRD